MNKINKRKIIFWVLIIIGIMVRIYNFPNAISEMNSDEIMTAVNAKSIVDTGKDCRWSKLSCVFTRLGRTKYNAIISYGFNDKNIWL